MLSNDQPTHILPVNSTGFEICQVKMNRDAAWQLSTMRRPDGAGLNDEILELWPTYFRALALCAFYANSRPTVRPQNLAAKGFAARPHQTAQGF
jgi:hypothetical protein